MSEDEFIDGLLATETETTETGPITIQSPGLIGAILTQMNRDRAFTTNALIDGYRTQAEQAEATLAAIRDRITELFEGPYAPNPMAILRALYPSDEVRARYLREESQ